LDMQVVSVTIPSTSSLPSDATNVDLTMTIPSFDETNETNVDLTMTIPSSADMTASGVKADLTLQSASSSDAMVVFPVQEDILKLLNSVPVDRMCSDSSLRDVFKKHPTFASDFYTLLIEKQAKMHYSSLQREDPKVFGFLEDTVEKLSSMASLVRLETTIAQ
ncbi:hypothetical protein A2U01_0023841, partial [Trifolium medium]|nr:hypothetical protein [Trifolium medium]